MQEKEIIITNLASRAISPKPGGKVFTPFTVYQIQGNDGITYETTFKDFFDELKIGQALKIKFKTETKTSNGKVYTSYKLQLPKRADPAIGELKAELLERLDKMEKNILAGIRVMSKPVVQEEPAQLSLFPDEPEEDTDVDDVDY